MTEWVVADWHLGEDRFEIMGRPFKTPEEHVETLIKNHNELVAPEDRVYMLGDVCYKHAPDYLRYVSEFNGKKWLIRGNHDLGISNDRFSKYFDVIVDEGKGIALTIEDIPCWMTHYPTQGKTDRFNLVGHIHSAWKYQLNMFNVGVDVNQFRPTNLNKIPFHFKAICEYYDEDVWVAYNQINSLFVDKRGKAGSYWNG